MILSEEVKVVIVDKNVPKDIGGRVKYLNRVNFGVASWRASGRVTRG
jgi:hypothetical protein